MIPTGNVERRGSRHAMHYEYKCDCGETKWLRYDRSAPKECTHKKQEVVQPEETFWYVMMSGREMPAWACGEATELDPWMTSGRAHFTENSATQELVWDPPESAQAFKTKFEATQWKLERIRWLASRGRPAGKYNVVKR